tara:strand:- start:541 stop:1440 length:900 start_codon:yes stop_codon:yes gene_type:complete
MGRFSSTGIVVGQTPRSKRDQKTDQLKGNKVTMGKNVPRQTEGAVGDITVREITTAGLRCYIKTNSGWYDINALKGSYVMDWRDIIFDPTTVTSWISNESASSGEKAKYALDQNGMVHLRGSILCLKISDTTPSGASLSDPWEASQSHTNVSQTSSNGDGIGMVCNITTDGSGNPTFALVVDMGSGHVAGDDITFTDPGNTTETAEIALVEGTQKTGIITTFPPGYRPYGRVVVGGSTLSETASIKILSSGAMNGLAQMDAGATFLDGITFFTRQVIDTPGQGGTRSSGGSSTGRGTTT